MLLAVALLIASVTGHVTTERRQPLANALVTLTPFPAASGGARTLHARTNANGAFRFPRVSPGAYRLLSRAEGRSDAIIERIEVERGRELLVREPIVQPPLAMLQITVSPAVPVSRERWNVALLRPGFRTADVVRVTEGPAGADGVWRRERLQAAMYLLRVSDARGSEVAQQSITLHGGEERLFVTVSAIELRGRVVSAGRGLSAELVFEHHSGRRVPAHSDGDGHFSASFPVAGEWSASAVPTAQGRPPLKLGSVAIAAQENRELALRIAGGRIRGRVVDPRGERRRAVVLARKDGLVVASTLAGEDGAYDLVGLQPGLDSLEAAVDEESAGPVAVEVREDVVEEVELRLTARSSLPAAGPSR